jgi:hypothetical protein
MSDEILMTAEDIELFFVEMGEEFLSDKDIRPERRLHPARDMNALLLLSRLCPDIDRMIAGAEHDVVYLGPGPENLAGRATKEDVIDLVRCGVHYDSEVDSLCKFV